MTITEAISQDGRMSISLPAGVLKPLASMNITAATLRTVVQHFLKIGKSHHSGNRMLLGALIAYCEENSISYRVTAFFSKDGVRVGYTIERVENL
jgi:hypothetical protein